MNKKYIAPFDMFDGKVKKGDIFEKDKIYQNESYYYKSNYYLPKEIVETWEELIEFIKGDFVTVSEYASKWIFIFKDLDQDNIYYFAAISRLTDWDNFKDGKTYITGRRIKHSTQEEKELLISKLKEQGKYYDVESHSIKSINPHQDMIDEWEKSGRTKIVQFKTKNDRYWTITSTPSWSEGFTYKFKPEPKYIPFTFEDHNLFKNVFIKFEGDKETLHSIRSITSSGIYFGVKNYLTYNDAFEELQFEDGKTFGKLIEE